MEETNLGRTESTQITADPESLDQWEEGLLFHDAFTVVCTV